MNDSQKWQKARIMHAAEMTRRAVARRDETAKTYWTAQFAAEVRRLNAMTRKTAAWLRGKDES